MKDFVHAALLAFSVSSLAAPLNTRQNDNVCNLASAVQITASGAAGVNNTFNVPFDNEWHNIVDGQALSISSVSWFGFPTVTCDFQGVNNGLMLQDGKYVDFKIIFDVGPPQALTSAKCLCG